MCEAQMKRMDIFCASQASTAICLSADQSSSSSSTILLGGKALDRHNPIIFNGVRTRTSTRALPTNPPCTFHSPIHPKPYHHLHKSRKSSSRPSKEQTQKSSRNPREEKNSKKDSKKPDGTIKKGSFFAIDIVKRSCIKPDNLATPPGSSRYLLRNSPLFDGLSDVDPVLAIVPSESKSTIIITKQEDKALEFSASQSTKPSSSNQVVVLRVSLHCKGCEGKVRKHISKMEGVRSFDIDFASKKVTIMGDVVPLNVLESVSKVKNAQFWNHTVPPSSASS